MGAADQPLDTWLCDGRPDWDAIEADVECSRCGYNLRLLPEPRCPECGLKFDWLDMLAAARTRHGFLFEHCWRRRPLRSLLGTLVRSFRPFRFWSQVSIHTRVHPRPLVFLLLVTPILYALASNGVAALIALALWFAWWLEDHLVGYWYHQTSEFHQLMWNLARMPLDMGVSYLALLGVVLLQVLAAMALLCGLRQTLGRCRVRTAQVLRVVVYSALPVVVLWGLLFLLVAVMLTTFAPFLSSGVVVFTQLAYLVMIPAVLGVYLSIGLSRYLHLTRAWLVGLTAAGVATLFMYTAVMFFTYIVLA